MEFLKADDQPLTRTIFLYGTITAQLVYDMMIQIQSINEEDDHRTRLAAIRNETYTPEPIVIDINTNGGSLDDGMALISAIEASETPIVTRVSGYAYSMGFFIFLAGTDRLMSKYARLMYHQGSSVLGGTQKDIEESLDEWAAYEEVLYKYVTDRCKLSKKDLKKIYKAKFDKYYFADEALALGIATEIY